MSANDPFSCIQELSAGYFASRCLHVAAELGVADALGDVSMRIENLAAATGSNTDALSRILRLLETHGVFAIEDGMVSQTPASSLLRSDHPTSMRDFSRMFGLTLTWRSAELLLDAVRTGEAAAPRAFEGGFWGRLESNPQEARVFDAAMTAKAMGQIGAILASYDFGAFNHIIDVGGGVPETHEPDWSKTLDIVMLTLFAARQRTAPEYRTLLANCNFDLRERTDTQAGITIFEAV